MSQTNSVTGSLGMSPSTGPQRTLSMSQIPTGASQDHRIHTAVSTPVSGDPPRASTLPHAFSSTLSTPAGGTASQPQNTANTATSSQTPLSTPSQTVHHGPTSPTAASPTMPGSTSSVSMNASPPVNNTTASLSPPLKPVVQTKTAPIGKSPNSTTNKPFHVALTDTLFWSALCSLGLVIFVSLITWKSSSLDWPLANISVSSGILLLTVLVKMTDWALDSLGDIGWEKLYWGPILQRNGNLITHLGMTSGIGAWWKILFSPPEVETPSSSRVSNFVRRVGRSHWPQFWAFWRIAVWLLIQVPGIIVMSSASTKTAYHPAGWSTVSGGLGIFNRSEIIEFPGDYVTYGFAFNILQDRSMATTTEAISEECQHHDNCKSSLLVGGIQWITPWPYMWISGDDKTAYLTRHMPVYQLEGWNTTTDKSISWTKDECRVYQADIYSTQVCAKASNKGGSILTGIRACDPDSVDDEGDCSLSPGWPGWDSFVAFSTTLDIYRLNISLAADRQTNDILEILDKEDSTLQDINPGDFLDAFDGLFCPWRPENATSSKYCEPGQLRNAATATLWAIIYRSYTPEASESSLAVDSLRNMYATALFLYNPVFFSTLSFDALPYSRKAQEGLADENYFPGSAARPSTYLAPAPWTVLAFVVLAGFLIVASVGAVILALWFKPPETSRFGVLDAGKVELVQVQQQSGALVSHGLHVFADGKTDKEVLRLGEGLRVRLKQG